MASTPKPRKNWIDLVRVTGALKKLRPDQRTFLIGFSTIQSSAAVQDLGIILNAELSVKQHINKTTAMCYYHLCRLWRICHRAGSEVTIRLVQAFITSRLEVDYFNSLLAALPESTIQPLQHVQNVAARLIFGLLEYLITSWLVWSSCIACPFASGYSINYVYWCTPYIAADHLCIWQHSWTCF